MVCSGAPWTASSCGFQALSSPAPDSRDLEKYRTHGPRGLLCPPVRDCEMGPHLRWCPNDRGLRPLISPNKKVIYSLRPAPSKCLWSFWGDSKGASLVPRLLGAPPVSTPFSFPILVSTCPLLTAFLLWIINHVLVITTLLLIMEADHLKSDVCANVCAIGAHPLPGRSSFIGRISQWLSWGYLELPPQRSCPEG